MKSHGHREVDPKERIVENRDKETAREITDEGSVQTVGHIKQKAVPGWEMADEAASTKVDGKGEHDQRDKGDQSCVTKL